MVRKVKRLNQIFQKEKKTTFRSFLVIRKKEQKTEKKGRKERSLLQKRSNIKVIRACWSEPLPREPSVAKAKRHATARSGGTVELNMPVEL